MYKNETLNILQFFRTKLWWNHIITPILGVSYFFLLFTNNSFKQDIIIIILIFISSIFTALFGFFLNDVTDITQDELSGKKNFVSLIPFYARIILLMLFLLGGTLPWFFITENKISYILIAVQYLLFILYSVKPFRFKKKIYLSVILDSLYSGIVFIMAVFFVFKPATYNIVYENIIFLIFLASLFMRGLRNILFHLIEDYENDLKCGMKTLAIQYGNFKIKKMIRYLIVPTEIITLNIFAFLVSFTLPFFYVGVLLFDVYMIYILFKKNNHVYLANNDFYEHILPIFVLIYLILKKPIFTIILVIHLIFFPKVFINIIFPFLKWIFDKIFVHLLYHNTIIWLYYKIFCNKYAKRFYKFLKNI